DMAAIIGGSAANYCCLSTLKIVISSEARNLSPLTNARHFERSEKPLTPHKCSSFRAKRETSHPSKEKVNVIISFFTFVNKNP
ncbi:MAG: hypothetical protein Q8R57_11170, partial [Bacteroidota bacterium]|nr:hypothetical protein [Bacteroidota bacterium]